MGIIRKRVACVCGAAIASSSSIKYQLEEFFERENVHDVELICCRFSELDQYLDHICLIVTASPLFKQYPVPTVSDTCYLSGIDCEATNRRILELIRSAPDMELY